MSDSEEEEEDQYFQAPINIPQKRPRSSQDIYIERTEDCVEASLCTLCQNGWTNKGQHAIVSLKCGHVFGKSCIDQDIRDSFLRKATAQCPVCDSRVTKSEPRRIWPAKIIPCDEEDMRLIKQKHKEADEIIEMLKNTLAILKLDMETVIHESAEQEEMLKQSIIKPALTSLPAPEEKTKHKGLFVHQHSFTIPNEKYRVMEILPTDNMAILSAYKSLNQTLPFGFRRVHLHDPTIKDFIPVHNGHIKDIKLASDNMILSTGLDKTLKLTSLKSKQVVQSYELDAPGWSCAADHHNLLYCGVPNSTTLVFDIRNTKNYIYKLIEPSPTFSPIHSMYIVNSSMLVCSNFDHSFCWKLNNDKYEYELLEQSTECSQDKSDTYKSFTMNYHQDILFTSLKNKKSIRYEIAHFDDESLKVDWYYDDLNHKQGQLTRHTQFLENDESCICFPYMDKVHIRNKDTLIQEIKVKKNVVDIKHVEQGERLVILTEDELEVYKLV